MLASIIFAPLAARAAVTCEVSATGVNFGSYDPRSGAQTSATGLITVTCQSNAPPESGSYGIALGPGASGGYTGRTMKLGSEILHYQLYTDPTYSAVWGDGTGGSQAVSGGYSLSDNTPQSHNHTIYGRIPAGQWPSAGSYSDSIMVTISY